MTLEAALAMLSVSAPVTVALIKFIPRRRRTETGAVTQREFRIYSAQLRDQLDVIRTDIRELREEIRGLFQ